ncbi:lipocalin family protein [bacterium]|nr:lipocalin family protein [bacterium]
MEKVDIQRYLGKWHEIARYPIRFQKDDCVAATAEYKLMSNG